MRDFRTFKPQDQRITKFISYYYIDFDDNPTANNQYICYPHFNTTLSFYESGRFEYADYHSQITTGKDSKFLKILTPIREEPLMVSQIGAKKKVAVVFEPLGINHFLQSAYQFEANAHPKLFEAFDPRINGVLQQIFEGLSIPEITGLLDEFFLTQLNGFNQPSLEQVLEVMHNQEENHTISKIVEENLGISRRQLGRLFKQHLGTTPHKYNNIVQFRQALNYQVFQDSVKNYTELAFKARYTDQSHFIKACKQLTKFTPGVFFNKGEQVRNRRYFLGFYEIAFIP